MGMSGAGKDEVINYISKTYNKEISVSVTTRPIRRCETQGVEYIFVTNEEFNSYEPAIPIRVYHTVFGDWKYLTRTDVKGKIVILDYNGTQSLCDYLGRENVIVIKLNVDMDIIHNRLGSRGDCRDEIKRRLADDVIKFKGSDDYADYVIDNNDSLEELYTKLNVVMVYKTLDSLVENKT